MKKIIALSLFTAFMVLAAGSVSADTCPPPWYETNCHIAYGYHWYDDQIACDNAYAAAEDACEPAPDGCYCTYYYMGNDTVWMGTMKMKRCKVKWCHCCFPG